MERKTKNKIILASIFGILILLLIIITITTASKKNTPEEENLNLSTIAGKEFTLEDMMKANSMKTIEEENIFSPKRKRGYNFSEDSLNTDDGIYQSDEEVALLQDLLKKHSGDNSGNNIRKPTAVVENKAKESSISSTIEKVIDTVFVQTVEVVEEVVPVKKNRFFRGTKEVETGNSVMAMVEGKQTVMNSVRLKMRLLDDLVTNNEVTIKKGTTIWGVVRITAERAEVKLETIRIGKDIIDVKKTVYDEDGQLGINLPTNIKAEIAKKAAANVVQTAENPTLGESGSIVNRTVNAVATTAKGLLAKDIDAIKFDLPANYRLYLK